ncbi:MAG TPA: iron-containing alcohol dehydrogenase [Spirochaetia bacterium]|nr:iron-containing alcohol dehydrogenase [Spirochaetia bacterium]
MELKNQAIRLLKQFEGESYTFGLGTLDKVGEIVSGVGKKVLIIADPGGWLKPTVARVVESIKKRGVSLATEKIAPAARPNAPREDVYLLETYILHYRPDSLVVIGGGSSIDSAKAANVLATVGSVDPSIEGYFGMGLVTEALKKTGKKLLPLIAIQTAASSGAHLTKYSNITDPLVGQKKLIVDDAIIPVKALFDYEVTRSAPVELTVDGALDGIAHCLEVFYGIGKDKFELCKEITLACIELVIKHTKDILANPGDLEAREAIGLATDLGGYAIMVGGTNGGHLTSFSLVDVTTHGRACGLMNPYYTVFFAPAIEEKLRLVGGLFRDYGFIQKDLSALDGRELGIAVAEGMIAFGKSIKTVTTLGELPGFSDRHIRRALEAAKNPQLDMKLKNMPVPLNASLIDEYMEPILRAAQSGNLELIKNLAS